MPNIPRIGISKKIESREERQRLRELLTNNLPQGMGAIIRTTSDEKDDAAILQDLTYLIETWTTIQERFKTAKPYEKIHEDIDLALQAVRDHLDEDVEEVICDHKDNHNKVFKFIKTIAPDQSGKVKFYDGIPSLFEKYGIEHQIDQVLHKKISLKSGGSIIDVNTGRYTGHHNLEDTILKINLEAAEEITRQLRLRNIGGLIVIDFIDMSSGTNRQRLYRFFEKNLKERDKFQSVVLRVSEFGLVQMTRKRSGRTLIQQLTQQCSQCHGSGFITSLPHEAYALLRKLEQELETKKLSGSLTLNVHPDMAQYITNTEYNSILYLEKTYRCTITIMRKNDMAAHGYKIEKS
jgi:ribonuclease G